MQDNVLVLILNVQPDTIGQDIILVAIHFLTTRQLQKEILLT